MLAFLEEVVAPRNRGSQRALSLLRITRSSQDVEPGCKSLEERGWRKNRSACGGQLDRERQVVESCTELSHHTRCRSAVEMCARGAGTRQEELRSILCHEGLDGEHVLAGNGQRLTARRNHESVGT